MTDENNSNDNVKLFRRPKPSKLIKIELKNIQDPNDSTEFSSDENFSKFDSIDNYNRKTPLPSISNEFLQSKLSKDSKNNKKDQFKILLNQKTSPRTDDLFNLSFQKRSLVNHSNLFNPDLKTTKPLGPDPLPMRQARLQNNYTNNFVHPKLALYENLFYDNDRYNSQMCNFIKRENQFSLNDFLLYKNSNKNKGNQFNRAEFFNEMSEYDEDDEEEQNENSLDVEHNIYISSDNYKKICKYLESRIQSEKNSNTPNIHIQTLIPDIEPFENRKPIRQTLIEMACFLKNELSEKTGAKLKTRFNPVSKWQKLNGAQTELVIYEEKPIGTMQNTIAQQSNEQNKLETEFQSEFNKNEEITPAHLAIIDCLLRNGMALSLKAFFIDSLPDISSLRKTLAYINLSFNNFREIPEQVLNSINLEAIKLRSNPIKYLPEKLANLTNLKILSLSYCLLNELEPCIFELENLVHLDVSYNKLTELNEKIVKLNKLATFNIEGNELEYLPSTMLKMKNLKQVNMKNNYMHPLIWRKYLVNEIPSLFAESAAKFENTISQEANLYNNLSDQLQDKLKNFTRNCDCCDGKIYGDGLKLIRPCLKIFGVKYVPFMFYSCSTECYNKFKKKK